MFGLGVQEVIFVLGLILVTQVLPYWLIFSKAGFSGWLSLAMLFPLINIVFLFYLAFAQWPIRTELDRAKRNSATGV